MILYLSANGFPRTTLDSKGRFSLEHVKALQDEGTSVVAVDMQADFFGDDYIDGVRVLRIPGFRKSLRVGVLSFLRGYLRAYINLRNLNYNCIIFSFFYLKYIPFTYLLKKRCIPTAIIAHGGEVMPGGIMRSMLKRWLFKRVDLVMPVSDFTATLFSCLIRRKNGDSTKIKTVYNGVDFQKLSSNGPTVSLRTVIGASSDDFLVLSISNLVRRKGIDIVIEAVDRLIIEGKRVRHVIVGSGPEESLLRSLSNKNGNGKRFHFISNVEDTQLGWFYRGADVFALLSRTDWDARQTEGFGIVYAEAMAVGTPVIGGAASGTTTSIQNGFTGILIDPDGAGAVDELAQALRRVFTDQEYRKYLSDNAKRHTVETFSWKLNAKITVREIQKLSGRVPR